MLRCSGFIESVQKAQAPRQIGVFLGLTIDTSRRLVFIPEEKLQRIDSAMQ